MTYETCQKVDWWSELRIYFIRSQRISSDTAVSKEISHPFFSHSDHLLLFTYPIPSHIFSRGAYKRRSHWRIHLDKINTKEMPCLKICAYNVWNWHCLCSFQVRITVLSYKLSAPHFSKFYLSNILWHVAHVYEWGAPHIYMRTTSSHCNSA